MTETAPKQYELETMKEFFDLINPDNFANLMTDFTDICIRVTQIKQSYKKAHGEYPKDIMKKLTWIDDNIRGTKQITFGDQVIKFDHFIDDNNFDKS